ncbi:hypothetical protein VTJ49DRAFT_3531 [Mycothermus thermophilus]|uniref:Uncharacterized protein n=1 Tax=Humicola insolens TaxID=85995 RepID=A0ABR3V7F3_HUMIN
MNPTRPRRPATRAGFEIAVICALPLEADAVDALFDRHWDDDGPPYDKAADSPLLRHSSALLSVRAYHVTRVKTHADAIT